jgi:hypothetical protein
VAGIEPASVFGNRPNFLLRRDGAKETRDYVLVASASTTSHRGCKNANNEKPESFAYT